MALFDYGRKMSQDTAAKEKTAEKSEVTKEAVVSKQADFEESKLGPVVMRQVPMDSIKPSLIDGYLKLDVKDDLSENGKGTLYVPSDCIKQSYDNNRTVLPGMRDIVIPLSLQDRLIYTTAVNGKLEKNSIEIDRLKNLVEAQSVFLKETKQAGIMTKDIRQADVPASEYKDV